MQNTGSPDRPARGGGSGEPSAHAEKKALWEVRQRYRLPHRTSPGGTASRAAKRPKRRQAVRRLAVLLLIILAAGGGIFGYKILAAGNKISVAERSLLGQLKDLLFNSDKKLGGETDGRINVLLIAIGGEGHKGEELADTIMVMSIRPSDGGAALLSIPRDFYVQVPGEEYFTKINAVHAYGESKKKDRGPELLKEKVEEITGLPLQYYARIDFLAFKHVIDALGGIDITIDRTFYDYWHKISFSAGTEHMNGERALAFVRARYIEGPEGGDFRRAFRQQQVLLALKDRAFSLQTALDFSALNTILNTLSNNIRTDMELWEMKRFYELGRTIERTNLHSVVLTTGPNGLLVGSTEILGGTPASVLKPRTGDYSEIQSLAQNIFSEGLAVAESAAKNPDPTPSESPSPTPEESITVEVRNGTNITGLAQQTKTKLSEAGYTVTAIGNAHNRATAETTVYALNLDQADSAKDLAALLKAASDSGLPKDEPESAADILIILGSNAST